MLVFTITQFGSCYVNLGPIMGSTKWCMGTSKHISNEQMGSQERKKKKRQSIGNKNK